MPNKTVYPHSVESKCPDCGHRFSAHISTGRDDQNITADAEHTMCYESTYIVVGEPGPCGCSTPRKLSKTCPECGSTARRKKFIVKWANVTKLCTDGWHKARVPKPPKAKVYKPSGKICGVKHEYTDWQGVKSQEVCNGQKGHDGKHGPNHDCCGDRYAVYVTQAHCKFCKRNEGWCRSCLEEHERKCATRQINKMRKQLANKAKA